MEGTKLGVTNTAKFARTAASLLARVCGLTSLTHGPFTQPAQHRGAITEGKAATSAPSLILILPCGHYTLRPGSSVRLGWQGAARLNNAACLGRQVGGDARCGRYLTRHCTADCAAVGAATAPTPVAAERRFSRDDSSCSGPVSLN